MAQALTTDILREADEVGRQIRQSVTRAIEASESVNVMGEEIARKLSIEGVIARRLVRLLNAQSNVKSLLRSPSPEGLRKVAAHVDAFDGEASEALHQAADRYEKLVQNAGISRSELIRALRQARD